MLIKYLKKKKLSSINIILVKFTIFHILPYFSPIILPKNLKFSVSKCILYKNIKQQIIPISLLTNLTMSLGTM